jgi:hypothetical protein
MLTKYTHPGCLPRSTVPVVLQLSFILAQNYPLAAPPPPGLAEYMINSLQE